MAAQTTLADINATLQKMKVGQDKVLDELQDQDKSSAQRAKDRLKEPKKPGSGGPGGPGGGPQKPQSKLNFIALRRVFDDLCESAYNHNMGIRPNRAHWEFATKRAGGPAHLHRRHMKRGRTQQFLFLEHVLSFHLSFC